MRTRTVFKTSAAILALTVSGALAQVNVDADATLEATTNAQVADATEVQTPAGDVTTPYWDESLENDYASIVDEPIERLIGMRVFSEGGEDLGEIDNFILNADNQIEAVVGVGGFLGLGEHEVAIPLADMRYDEESRVIVLKFSETEIEAMPEYTEEYAGSVYSNGDMLRDGPIVAQESATAEMDVDAELMADDQVVDNAMEETGEALDATGGALADAADAAGEALENTAEDAEGVAENAMEETGEALDATGEAMADAAEETGEAFQQIADWTVNDLEGTNVASASGEVIGEIDYIGERKSDGEVVAIVGIGGFLGLGEHEVALSLDNLTWDSEHFVAEGYTEAELKEMPEYDAEAIVLAESDVTLRSIVQ